MRRRRRIVAAIVAAVLGSLSGAAASPAEMHVSPRGLALIKHFEGFPNGGCPYRDPIGVWTRGYGRIEGIGPGSPCISEPAAARELVQLLRTRYEPSLRALELPLNQNQWDASTSAIFNLGVGILDRGRSFGDALRARRWRQAADSLLLYVHAGGRVFAGLVRRREAERRLFLTPVPVPATSPPLTRVETRINRGILRPATSGHTRRYWCQRNARQRARLRRLAARRGWRAQHGGVRHHRLARRYAASCPRPRARSHP